MSLATYAQTNDLPGLLQRLDAGHGPDDPSEGENGFSPLFFAIVLGNTDIVGVLLSSGAKTEWRDPKMGRTALHRAAAKGNLAVVEQLVEAGANLDARASNDDRTALMLSAFSGNRACCWALLGAGADAAVIRGRGGQTATQSQTTCRTT